MKQIFIFCFAMFFVIGCTPRHPANTRMNEDKYWWREKYGGHTYVLRNGDEANRGTVILHDPDCPCQTNVKTIHQSNTSLSK